MFKMNSINQNVKRNQKNGFMSISFSKIRIFIFTIICCCAFLGSNLIMYSQPGESQLFDSGIDGNTEYVPDEIIVKFKSEAALKVKNQLNRKKALSKLRLNASLDRLHKRNPLKAVKALCTGLEKNRQVMNGIRKKMLKNKNLTDYEMRLFRRSKRAKKNLAEPDISGIYTIRVDLAPGKNILDVLEEYRKNPAVEYAGLNYLISCDVIPIDPLFKDANNNYQWSLHNDEGLPYPDSGRYNPPPGTPDSDIDCPEAWDITTGSPDIVVAVLDTGIDYTHRDLQGNLWINTVEQNGTPGIDDDDNGYIDDIYGYDFGNDRSDNMDDHGYISSGHGTHCAGTIGAKGNNTYDIAGVCWDVKVMGLKIMGGQKDTVDAAIEAICYATVNGADILSNSWGVDDTRPFLPGLQDAINYAASQGVVCFASAGNNHNSVEQYPAAFDNVIAVAALDSNNDKVDFSNFGDWVDIAAPGVDILSLKAKNTVKGTYYDEYTTICSGTSMACPTAAGVGALVLSINPTLTVNQLTTLMKTTGDPIADGICESDKKINAYDAVSNALTSDGYVRFDEDAYTVQDVITVSLGDADLASEPSVNVFLEMTTSGPEYDIEIFTLYPISGNPGLFHGSILTSGDPGTFYDDTLYVVDGADLEVFYWDADDGSGQGVSKTDTATGDCIDPVITVTPPDGTPVCLNLTIHVETDENSFISINYGQDAGLSVYHTNSKFGKSVDINIDILEPGSTYYFEVSAEDIAGNIAVDDNQGSMYSFTTTPYDPELQVPGEYGTIQQAIDAAWNDASVIVAQGIYNENIVFKGKRITLRSEDPDNENVVANTVLAAPEDFQVFFSACETRESVLSGFTIDTTNTVGIWVDEGSPTIKNCTIAAPSGLGSFGIYLEYGAPLIENVVIENCSYGIVTPLGEASPYIRNCTISNCNYGIGGYGINNFIIENSVFHSNAVIGIQILRFGAVLPFDGIIRNNLIYENDTGIALSNAKRISLTGNTIVDNTSTGLRLSGTEDSPTTDITVHSTIIWGHPEDIEYLDFADPIDLTYSCIEDETHFGYGVINNSPHFLDRQNDDYHIDGNYSECKNAGKPGYQASASETDMDRQPRVIEDRIDIGADELPAPTPGTEEYQAEDGTWINAEVEDEHDGYTGTGYVNTDNASGNWVEFSVQGSGSNTELVFFFANGSSSARSADVTFNGDYAGSLVFAKTGAWTSWTSETLTATLPGGTVAVRVTATNSSGLPNMDKLEVTPVRAP